MLSFECKERYTVDDFRAIIALLRSEQGCPWDAEQTHESIRRNLLEEAYEVCEAIDEADAAHLREELGDLLMQVIFHARIEEEQDRFDLDDVADAACKKLILRHPHVFGNVDVANSDEVLHNWDEIKRKERAQETVSSVMDGVARSLPALWRAEKIQHKAAKAGFDWPDIQGPLDKLSEELAELREAVAAKDAENAMEELGDLLFAAANAARFLKADPEQALHQCCEKFIRRYALMEQAADKDGVDLTSLSLEEMEKYYQLGRKLEKRL